MRRITFLSMVSFIIIFRGISVVAQGTLERLWSQIALAADKKQSEKDQLLWSAIKVDPASGVVTANEKLWTEHKANLYVSNDRKDIFYFTRGPDGKGVKRTIELKNYGILYSDRYENGALAAKTFCMGTNDCISIYKEFCDQMLKLMKAESPKKLMAKVSACDALNDQKASAWRNLEQLTRKENDEMKETLSNSMVMDVFKGIKITRSLQINESLSSVDALSFKALRMCDDAFWGREQPVANPAGAQPAARK